MFIHDLIAITWKRLQLIPDFQNAWDFFYSEFTMVVDKLAPLKMSEVNGRHLIQFATDIYSVG